MQLVPFYVKPAVCGESRVVLFRGINLTHFLPHAARLLSPILHVIKGQKPYATTNSSITASPRLDTPAFYVQRPTHINCVFSKHLATTDTNCKEVVFIAGSTFVMKYFAIEHVYDEKSRLPSVAHALLAVVQHITLIMKVRVPWGSEDKFSPNPANKIAKKERQNKSV